VKTITNVQIIGEIAGEPDRKTVNVKGTDKAVTEFRIAGVGLRIAAWEARASEVPDSGIVIVNGYLNTRTYTYEGKDREATDIRCTSIQAIAPADSDPF
jgi:single-stranded DNA-binding protein